MGELEGSPLLSPVKEGVEIKLLEFMLANADEIVRQSLKGLEREDCEVPEVPLFEDYLLRLKPEIVAAVAIVGHSMETAERMISHFRNVFYRSSLPNLAENVISGYSQR